MHAGLAATAALMGMMTRADAKPRELVILPLGDSITRGDPSEDGYRGFLRDELSKVGIAARFVGSQQSAAGSHEGWTGYTAEELHPKVGGGFLGPPPDVVLIHIGTNDLGMGFDPAAIVVNVGRLLDRVLELGRRGGRKPPRILLARIIPRAIGPGPDPALADYNRRLVSLVGERRKAGQPIELCDAHAPFDPATDLADALHPNASGYRKLARMWARAIAPPR